MTSPMTALSILAAATPDDNDVVAGSTAFVVFALLALAVVVLSFSLTKRLKNVEKAADAGLYDPSDPKRTERPARGLALARQLREEREEREESATADDERLR